MSPESASEREARLDRALEGKKRGTGADARRAGVKRSKPVRLTADLDPELWRRLKSWTTYNAAELDVLDVPAAEVIRVLLTELTQRPEDERFDEETALYVNKLVISSLRRRMRE